METIHQSKLIIFLKIWHKIKMTTGKIDFINKLFHLVCLEISSTVQDQPTGTLKIVLTRWNQSRLSQNSFSQHLSITFSNTASSQEPFIVFPTTPKKLMRVWNPPKPGNNVQTRLATMTPAAFNHRDLSNVTHVHLFG